MKCSTTGSTYNETFGVRASKTILLQIVARPHADHTLNNILLFISCINHAQYAYNEQSPAHFHELLTKQQPIINKCLTWKSLPAVRATKTKASKNAFRIVARTV